jgi:REP element-mobilizing transposase RayT
MKPGTFTQIYVQLVFAVKNRETSLRKEIRPHVFEYMSGILTNQKHKSIIINGLADHVHILFGMNPSVSVSDTVHEVRSSTLFINRERLCFGKSPGRKAMEHSVIVVRKFSIFTKILRIRKKIIN